MVKFIDCSSIPAGGANYAAVPADARVPVEPLFAQGTVEYVGQPVGVVVATSRVRPHVRHTPQFLANLMDPCRIASPPALQSIHGGLCVDL